MATFVLNVVRCVRLAIPKDQLANLNRICDLVNRYNQRRNEHELEIECDAIATSKPLFG